MATETEFITKEVMARVSDSEWAQMEADLKKLGVIINGVILLDRGNVKWVMLNWPQSLPLQTLSGIVPRIDAVTIQDPRLF